MQEYNVYAIGQRAVLEAFNRDEDGDLAPAVNPRILLKPPTGPEESLAVTQSPAGHIFHVLPIEGPAGKYFYRIVTDDDALEHFFVVRASEFTDPLGS